MCSSSPLLASSPSRCKTSSAHAEMERFGNSDTACRSDVPATSSGMLIRPSARRHFSTDKPDAVAAKADSIGAWFTLVMQPLRVSIPDAIAVDEDYVSFTVRCQRGVLSWLFVFVALVVTEAFVVSLLLWLLFRLGFRRHRMVCSPSLP
jgi:hypothetical protein